MVATPPLDPSWAAQTKGPTIIAFICILVPLSTFFCAMRLYTRGIIMGKLQLDDYFIASSVLCSILTMIFTIKAIVAGDGRHFLALPDDKKAEALLWSIIAFTPSIESFALPKLGVVALLVRLLSPGPAQKCFLWMLAIVCFISLSLCSVIFFTSCEPARALWDITITEKQCRDPSIIVKYSIYAGTISAATDLYLAIYPAIVLFNLQMRLKKKIALSVVLGIGSVASVVSIYKITRIPALASPDFTYETGDLAIWTIIESSTLIISACIPVLNPLYERIFGHKAFSKSSKAHKYEFYNAWSDSGKHHYDLELKGATNNKRRGPRDPNGLTFLDVTSTGSEDHIVIKRDAELLTSSDPRFGQSQIRHGTVG